MIIRAGIITLRAGVASVSHPGITPSSVAVVSLSRPDGTLGATRVATCADGSLTVRSLTLAGEVETRDASVLNYLLASDVPLPN